MTDFPFSNQQLFEFIDRAGEATWASDGEKAQSPERIGFTELIYKEDDLLYRDSFTGSDRSWGTELVRYQEKPVWNCVYGGGMVDGFEQLADETYSFLKKALREKESTFQSFRGPQLFEEGEWKYVYEQKGPLENFQGYEEIYFKGDLVHFYRLIGGIIK